VGTPTSLFEIPVKIFTREIYPLYTPYLKNASKRLMENSS
jgi:hypothetical protein